MSTQVLQCAHAALRFKFGNCIAGAIETIVGIVLDEANLALLVGARLRVINALPLPRRDQRHHPGVKNDAWVVEDAAGLVSGNNAAMVADAELCTEHARGNKRAT